VKYRDRPPGSQLCCPSPLSSTFPTFGESFGSKQWLFCEQTGVFSVPRALIRYNYRRIWHVRRLNFLAVNLSHAHPTLLSAKRLGPTAGLSPNGSSQLAQAQHCPASSPRIQWTSRYSTPGDFPIHDLCQSPCTRHRCKLPHFPPYVASSPTHCMVAILSQHGPLSLGPGMRTGTTWEDIGGLG